MELSFVNPHDASRKVQTRQSWKGSFDMRKKKPLCINHQCIVTVIWRLTGIIRRISTVPRLEEEVTGTWFFFFSILEKNPFYHFNLCHDADVLTGVSISLSISFWLSRRRVGELWGGWRREPLPHRVPPPERPVGRPGEHGPIGRVQTQRRGAEVGSGDQLVPAGWRRELQHRRPRAPLWKRKGQEQWVRKRKGSRGRKKRGRRGRRERPWNCSTKKKEKS